MFRVGDRVRSLINSDVYNIKVNDVGIVRAIDSIRWHGFEFYVTFNRNSLIMRESEITWERWSIDPRAPKI